MQSRTRALALCTTCPTPQLRIKPYCHFFFFSLKTEGWYSNFLSLKFLQICRHKRLMDCSPAQLNKPQLSNRVTRERERQRETDHRHCQSKTKRLAQGPNQWQQVWACEASTCKANTNWPWMEPCLKDVKKSCRDFASTKNIHKSGWGCAMRITALALCFS